MKISRSILENIVQEELKEFTRRGYIDNFIDEKSKLLIDKILKLLIGSGISTVEVLEYFRARIEQLEELNTTGTGASMTPGQGEQFTSPKAFKKKDPK